MNEIINKIKSTTCTDNDQYFENIYKNKSCAVIGNGGVILENKDGHVIDNHDIVLRCNQTQTLGYEESVGTKTNVRMINSHFFVSLKEGQNSRFVNRMKGIFEKFDENYLLNLKNEIIIVKFGVQKQNFIKEIEMIERNNNKVIFMSPSFYNLGYSMVGTHPTNGFMAVLFGLKFFEKVSHFGFGFYEEKDNQCYFQNLNLNNATNPSCHNALKEKALFQEFEKNNFINRRGV